MNDKEAEAAIAEFMEKVNIIYIYLNTQRQQNRPYSVQNILDSFQQRIKKTQCQKIMDELTTQQILTCKEYGKAKIYLINQDLFDTKSAEELAILDDQIKIRKDENDALLVELKQLQIRLKETSQGQSNTDISSDIKQHKTDIKSLQDKIKPFVSGGRKLVTQDEINKADKKLKNMQQEWKRRKKACMEIVDQISESAEMNRKDFIKKLNLETDEEYKVVCPI
ncbi:tbpip domain-containing protein [Stylonychia lemnae]|uniref:Homologous-pairing protein 2 homolog n=1 Tax=Stylonychia lemnae TaxID=5949 RepID=A0A078BDG3_STYLE|nr:tbpip domain-containing protein [Stylonychia lemnae]|eukprot:CDW91633.1 tbpip domain-containing protein [Stylonychia lemnae]